QEGLLYFEKNEAKNSAWVNSKETMEKYDHPLWKEKEANAEKSGHGGMDYFMMNDFIECIKANKEFPFDVYDLATWLAVSPLSEKSILENSAPQEMPDFTKGRY